MRLLRVSFLMAHIGATLSEGPPKPPKYPCPCDDASLCAPLSPQPPMGPPRDEVVAFTSWVFNGEQPVWANASARKHRVWTAPEHLDFGKITVLAPFDDVNVAGPYHAAYAKNGNNSDFAQLWCEAKRSGTRILTWGYQGWDGNSCPVAEFYGWLRGGGGGGGAGAGGVRDTIPASTIARRCWPGRRKWRPVCRCGASTACCSTSRA